MDPHHGHRVKRLHYAAAELPSALDHANQELPADFPDDALRQIAANLQALEDATTEAEHLVLVHARSTLRNARRMLQGDPGELETSLERTLKDIVVEIDELLDAVPLREVIALRPQEDPGPVVRRSELEGKVVALGQRLDDMEAAGRQSITQIYQYGFINIGPIKFDLDALIKVAGEFKAEIANKLIDLSWLTHFIEQVKVLSDAIRKGAAEIKQTTSELANFVHGLQLIHRLGNRVFQGGRALVHALNRRVQRLSSSPTISRDIDASWRPKMVVIPQGKFTMGSPSGEEGRWPDEGPQREVIFAHPFELGRFLVTFDQYDHFCVQTKREKAADEGWGRGRRPVINVSWDDAKAYCAWLGKQTGEPYRLPSEAEWEYACRAGTTTRFSWGDNAAPPERANFEFMVHQTTEIGTYPPNPWGLHDMHGNVLEWVEDCWHDSYQGAPLDGRAWLGENGGDCSRRVLRGGPWSGLPVDLRSATRNKGGTGLGSYIVGFRVARTLR